jgi:AraC family transcriptional regulator, transcriptional activator FtrA
VRKKAATPALVAAVVADGFSPFEFAIACEVFGIDRTEDVGRPWYRFVVCAADPGPVATKVGFSVNTPHGLEVLDVADTIVVPTRPPGESNPALLDALRRANARGARILSLCTGAFLLAEAGLLDGRRATTHWMYAAELARRFPRIDVDPGVLYIDDGDILTSAGTAAGIDLCLHVVRQDYGAEAANLTARRMVVPPHRDGGQAQYVRQPVPAAASPSDPFADTLVWAQEHLDETITVELLASRSAMSARTFARCFRDRTGTTPHQWLLGVRVLLAQRLLETTELPIEIVAARCGLGTATNLRQHFQRIVRTTPTAYRRTFHAIAG